MAAVVPVVAVVFLPFLIFSSATHSAHLRTFMPRRNTNREPAVDDLCTPQKRQIHVVVNIIR
jgi:hypothetical protein